MTTNALPNNSLTRFARDVWDLLEPLRDAIPPLGWGAIAFLVFSVALALTVGKGIRRADLRAGTWGDDNPPRADELPDDPRDLSR
jgi:hypothetical protein